MARGAVVLDPCPYLLIGRRCPDASCVRDFVRPWGEVEKQTDPGAVPGRLWPHGNCGNQE